MADLESLYLSDTQVRGNRLLGYKVYTNLEFIL